MRYVPSQPPAGGVAPRRHVQGVSRVKPVRAVQHRTLPPLVLQPHRALVPAQEAKERRGMATEDRRKYCRRILQQTLLEELRSGLERRRHRQRARDSVEHIDEKV